MLAVDRENGGAGPAGQPHDQRAGHHERFLVGQGDRLARLDRRPSTPQAGGTDDRRDHPIDGGVGDEFVEGIGSDGQSGARGQGTHADLGRRGCIDHDDPCWPQAMRLLDQGANAAVGGEQPGGEAAARRRHDIQRAGADAAGRTEHRHAEGRAVSRGVAVGGARQRNPLRRGISGVGQHGLKSEKIGH